MDMSAQNDPWLFELEVEWGEDPLLNINDLEWFDVNINENDQGGITDTMFGEQLAAALQEDFPNNSSIVSTDQSNTSSPTFPLDYLDYMTTSDDVPNISNNINNNNNIGQTISLQQTQLDTNTRQSNGLDLHDTDDHQPNKSNKNASKDSKQQQQEEETVNGERPKRRRQANQVEAHIMAERKRRELLAQRFIALSAIVPGLKKTDKTSVLGEAIKYLRQLQEKVKTLEEVVAKHTVESVMVVKKSQVIVDNNDNGGSGGVRDNDSSSFNADSNNKNESLPQIEVKVSGKTLLFRVHCEKEKGILTKLFCEVEKHGITVVNANIFPFGALALDITILAQMEIGFEMNIKEIISSIHSSLVPATQ